MPGAGQQLEGIRLDKQFVDKASGKDLHRPELEKLIGYVCEGDTVVYHSMHRLPATWTVSGKWSSGSQIAAFTSGSKRRT